MLPVLCCCPHLPALSGPQALDLHIRRAPRSPGPCFHEQHHLSRVGFRCLCKQCAADVSVNDTILPGGAEWKSESWGQELSQGKPFWGTFGIENLQESVAPVDGWPSCPWFPILLALPSLPCSSFVLGMRDSEQDWAKSVSILLFLLISMVHQPVKEQNGTLNHQWP